MTMRTFPLSRSHRDPHGPSWRLLGVSISDSTAITGATETESNFDNSVVLPANVLRVGSKIRIKGLAKHTATTGAETHSMLVKVGATTLLTVAAIDPANSDTFQFEIEVTVTAIGASGVVTGFAKYRVGTATAGNFLTVPIDAVTLDTTAANTVAAAIDRQAAATDSDSAILREFSVEVML
jgi:hypothetical protein